MAVTLGNGNITFGDGTVIETSAMVKSIQKGTTVGAGNVTISSITVAKSVIMSSSKGSAGSVAATGTLNLPAQSLALPSQCIQMGAQTVNMNCQATCMADAPMRYSWAFGNAAFCTNCCWNQVNCVVYSGTSYNAPRFVNPVCGCCASNMNYCDVLVGSPGCASATTGSASAQPGFTCAATATISACSSGSISGGSTSLIAKQYSAYIVNSTTIYADGPVEWQVIEYY